MKKRLKDALKEFIASKEEPEVEETQKEVAPTPKKGRKPKKTVDR